MHDHVKLPQRVHNCFDVLIQFVDIAVLDPVADRCASSRTCCRRRENADNTSPSEAQDCYKGISRKRVRDHEPHD